MALLVLSASCYWGVLGKHNLKMQLLLLLLLWPHRGACGIFVLRPGIQPHPLQWKCRVLIPEPPGKSQDAIIFILSSTSPPSSFKVLGPEQIFLL